MTYTATELAASFNLWAQYVDPDACYTHEEFEEMSIEQREAVAQSVIYANQ